MKTVTYLIVHTTVDERAKAEFLSRTILEARLAACIQIVPIHSFYRWEGKLESADEYRLEIKTRTDRYDALQALLLRHHPYDTPEILAIPVTGGSEGYLRWVDGECGSSSSPKEQSDQHKAVESMKKEYAKDKELTDFTDLDV